MPGENPQSQTNNNNNNNNNNNKVNNKTDVEQYCN